VAWPLFDEHAHGRFVAQAVAGGQGIGQVEGWRIVRPDGRGDAALGVAGVALVGLGLGKDETVAGATQSGCRAEGGDAAADDQEARGDPVILPSASMPTPPTRTPVRLTVRTSTTEYPVVIEPGVARNIGPGIDAALRARRRFIVSSPTVWRFHGEQLRTATTEEPILIPDGERFKTLATTARIYDALIKAQADRGCAIIAAGGGVVGDVAGFAAATFLRGVPVVQVPTTLLAQVDSAIGGKTGVNHALAKNSIGAFHQPSAVIIDPELLATLPRREFRAGLYEIVKYGVIADPALFATLESDLPRLFAREMEPLVGVIAASCRIKAQVVGADEREAGLRRVLNFGHTAGHALEAVTRYRRFRHGEAVAYGMLVAAELATARGVMPGADRERLRALVTAMGPLPPIGDLDAAQILDTVARDKKVVDGTLHYILPTGIGRTIEATDVAGPELLRALQAAGLRG
jgi:3-dehydroquinate synthase